MHYREVLSSPRDLIIHTKGDTLPVSVHPDMIRNGWKGGQGVVWAPSVKDEFLVTYSDGVCAGFLLWGSNESSDQYTAMTNQQPHYGFAVLGFGGWIIQTTTLERFTLSSRISNASNPSNPLIPIVYSPNDPLSFSLRGSFTNEDEWTIVGDPRAPNGNYIGVVSVPPETLTSYITIQTFM